MVTEAPVAPVMGASKCCFKVTTLSQSVSWLSRPTLRRAFSLALLLHVCAGGVLLVAVRYWPVARLRPVSEGWVVDVVPPLPAPVPSGEPTELEQALAVIPPEARAAPVPEVPEDRALMVPEPPVQAPEQTVRWVPVMPEIQLRAGPVGVEPAVKGRSAPAGKGKLEPAVQGRSEPAGGGRPIALSAIQPHYPYGARVRGEAGRVTVHLRVSEQGEVETAEVVAGSGHPALDVSAVAAAKAARFKPAEQGGRPVASEMNLQFEFRLEER